MAETRVYGQHDLTGHLILFAKGHYGNPENVSVYDRLVDFMWRWSWTPKEYYSKREIYHLVAESFTESCDKRLIKDFIVGIYNPIRLHYIKETLTIDDSIESMVGLMGIIQVKDKDEHGWYDLITLPEIDTGYIYGSPLPEILQEYEQVKQSAKQREKRSK